MPENEDSEITTFVDFLPNLVKLGQTKIVEDILRKNFEESLPGRVARYGKLPYIVIKLERFYPLVEAARHLYVDEYYTAAVALCGMTVESLCNAIAEERVSVESLKKLLTDPSVDCRKKIEFLKNYFKATRSASLLHRVLDIRKDYVHLHRAHVLPEEILTCINALHLAVIAEYGLVPTEGGKARFAIWEDIERLAGEMGFLL